MSNYTYDEYKVTVELVEGATIELIMNAWKIEDIYLAVGAMYDGKFDVIDIKKL